MMAHLRPIRYLVLTGLLLPVISLAQPVTNRPVDFDYTIGYRAEHQTNPALVSGNQDSEFINALFLQLGVRRDSQQLSVDVNGFFDYLDYWDNTFENEFRANLSTNVLWRIAPERFHWIFEDDLGRAPLDPRQVQSIANEQQTNLLTTGPDFIFRLNAADKLVLGARYSDFYADETDDDSERVSASVSWSRELSSSSVVGARLQATQAKFEDAGLSDDFDQIDAFLQYSQRRFSAGSATNEYRVDLGYSVIELDNRPDFDSPLVRLSWTQLRPDGTSFFANLGVTVGNAATTLGDITRTIASTQVGQASATGDPFKRQSIDGGLTRTFGRLGLGLSAEVSDYDYDVANEFDEDSWQVGVTADYRINPLMRLSGGVDFRSRDFSQRDQNDDLTNALIRFDYQRTRHWSYGVNAGWSDRDSSVAALSADDVRFGIEIAYRR